MVRWRLLELLYSLLNEGLYLILIWVGLMALKRLPFVIIITGMIIGTNRLVTFNIALEVIWVELSLGIWVIIWLIESLLRRISLFLIVNFLFWLLILLFLLNLLFLMCLLLFLLLLGVLFVHYLLISIIIIFFNSINWYFIQSMSAFFVILVHLMPRRNRIEKSLN